jgi:glycosyltransferase involved in cell wall biosynthesis
VPAAAAQWPFRVQSLRSWLNIGNASVVPGVMRALRQADIVHLHLPFYGGAEYVWLGHVLSGKPYVVTYHMDVIGDSWLRRAIFQTYDTTLLRRVVHSAARVLAVSDQHLPSTKIWRYLDQRRVTVVPNGVDTKQFMPAAFTATQRLRQQLTIPADAFVLLIVAGLDRPHFYKGVDTFLKTIAAFAPATSVYGIVVGDGELRSQYEQQAQALGIAPRVRFVSQKTQAELPLYYSASDLTVMPSHIPESFGLVLAESLACATPVVAVDCPGTRALVQPSKTGWLVPLNDNQALLTQLQQCLVKRVELPIMGEQGRQHMQQQFDWSVITPRLENVYRAVAAAYRPV